jgi:hypothetical protein
VIAQHSQWIGDVKSFVDLSWYPYRSAARSPQRGLFFMDRSTWLSPPSAPLAVFDTEHAIHKRNHAQMG